MPLSSPILAAHTSYSLLTRRASSIPPTGRARVACMHQQTSGRTRAADLSCSLADRPAPSTHRRAPLTDPSAAAPGTGSIERRGQRPPSRPAGKAGALEDAESKDAWFPTQLVLDSFDSAPPAAQTSPSPSTVKLSFHQRLLGTTFPPSQGLRATAPRMPELLLHQQGPQRFPSRS